LSHRPARSILASGPELTMPLRLIPDIHRATHRIRLHLDRFAGLDVSQGEAHLLAHLAAFGDSTIAELHRALAHRRSTLTSLLDRMEKRGLITRTTSRKDRRSFDVRLTAKGKKLARRVYKILDQLEAGATRRLSRQDLESFQKTLRALEQSFSEHAKS
jgi:DNA-binding MarR family transcriptional regulator